MYGGNLPKGKVLGLFAGKIEVLWSGKPSSAIRKTPINGPAIIKTLGFTQDQQADLNVHGGNEKALHHYAHEHLQFWRDTFPENASAEFTPGCFGENICTTGLTEQNLHIGDILTLGSAIVQACQGRQPCWKLNAHLKNTEMVSMFHKTLKTGWYYRVLKNGTVSLGDTMEIIDRVEPDWSIQKVTQARFCKSLDIGIASTLSQLACLSESWRLAFKKKKGMFTEDTNDRINGP